MSTLTRAALGGAAWMIDRVVLARPTPLAEPPAGSGLRPVMGDQGLPYLGWAPNGMSDFPEWARKRYAAYGPVSWAGFIGLRSVWVVGPDAVGVVLNNRDKAYANGPAWSYFLGPFFRRGIMLLDGGEHLDHRQIMQQAFGSSQLQAYLDAMNTRIARTLADWQPRNDFRLYDANKHMLLDIATEVFVGEKPGPESDEVNRAFIDTVAAGLSYVRADIPGGGWHRGLVARRRLEEYFRALLPAKRAGNGTDLFSQLCRAATPDGMSFTDEDVVNHMIFVLMAAHDTSSITTSTLAYYLAKHPQWQDMLRGEAQAIGKPTLEYQDIDRLPLLDMAFRETLRLNPAVGGIMRQAVKDTAICGQFIPAGTTLFVLPVGMHRLEEYWANPDRFDPQRFAPHRQEHKQHPFLWSPFGGGVHKCIGMYFGAMQVKSIIYQLLLNYTWSVPKDYEAPMEYGTGYFPGDGLPVRLTRLEA